MKFVHYLIVAAVLLSSTSLAAKEVRRTSGQADEQRLMLIERAEAEKAAAVEEARQTRAAIGRDRAALEAAVAELETKKTRLKTSIAELRQEETANTAQESELDTKLRETDGMVRELVGQIRINAKDLDELISQDPRSAAGAAAGQPLSFLSAVAGDEKFPGMDEIRVMTDALMEITRHSGEVDLSRVSIVDREGREGEADVLFAGPFTAVYRAEGESGFLNFTPGSTALYALANLPSSTMQKRISSYMAGESPALPMDISRGGALRQISHRVDFLEQIRQGGPIVYPILALLVLGLFIVVERIISLLRNRQAKPPLISYIRELAENGDWPGCLELCESRRWQKKPMGRVLGAGLAARNLAREDVENALHEAILMEVPKLERGLSTLSMFTAIAPLLGLLGTVTGMINVFHVITLYGASDPRMMSSGISEALVTTMLGLSVAIPLMLLHNMVSRGVDHIVDDMEEQSVSLVNLICRKRAANVVKNEKP